MDASTFLADLKDFNLQLEKDGITTQNLSSLTKKLIKFNTDNKNTFKFAASNDYEGFTGVIFGIQKHLVSKVSGQENQADVRPIYQQAVKESLSCLKIFSREKQWVSSIVKEKEFVNNLLAMGGMLPEGDCDEILNNLLEQDDKQAEAMKGIEFEAVRCICNCVFHNEAFRGIFMEKKCAKSVTDNLKEKSWNSNDDFQLIQVKILFLISALEVDERKRMRVEFTSGQVLIDLLEKCLENYENKDFERGTNEQGHIEITKKLTENDTKLTSEILKALFNITVSASDNTISETESDAFKKLSKIIYQLLTDFAPLPEAPEVLISHIAHMLINIPKACAVDLTPSVKRRPWQDQIPKRNGYPVEFELKDMSAIISLVSSLDEELKKGPSPSQNDSKMFAILTSLSHVCRCLRLVRKFLRFQILPPLREVITRPEESNTLKGRLVKLLTNSDISLKNMAADFLFVLCKEDTDRLVKYTGYGNSAGFLAMRGLMGGRKAEVTGDYSSDDDDSETEEYSAVANDIDPVTGAISLKTKENNPTQGMTEEEKAASAEELMGLIGQLSSLNVIKPMAVGADGVPRELNGEEAKQIFRGKLDHDKGSS